MLYDQQRKKKQKREVKKTILKVEKKRYNALGREFDEPKMVEKQKSEEVLVKQYTLTDGMFFVYIVTSKYCKM